MRKVLLVSHGAALGGSPISCLNIALSLRGEFECQFLFGEAGPVVERARAAGFPVTVMVKHRGLRSVGLMLSVFRLIRHERIDLVHLNTLTSYYKYPAWAAWLARVPSVWFVRENPLERRCQRLMPWLRRLPKRVVTVSHDTARDLDLPAGMVETIHNGVDLTTYAPGAVSPADAMAVVPTICKGRVLFGVVAMLETRKRVIETVRGFAHLASEDYCLVIVGMDRTRDQAYLAELKALIDALGVADRVHLLGEMPDVRPFLAAIDVFVLLSDWEGLSRAILEAMAMGKAVIASPRGGNPEQVESGENGCLVEAADGDGIATAAMRYIEDRELIGEHGRRSRELAEERFDMRLNAARFLDLYRRTLA